MTLPRGLVREKGFQVFGNDKDGAKLGNQDRSDSSRPALKALGLFTLCVVGIGAL